MAKKSLVSTALKEYESSNTFQTKINLVCLTCALLHGTAVFVDLKEKKKQNKIKHNLTLTIFYS